MKKFKIYFKANKEGSIGLPQNFSETVTADSRENAIKLLYNMGYEHITILSCKQGK